MHYKKLTKEIYKSEEDKVLNDIQLLEKEMFNVEFYTLEYAIEFQIVYEHTFPSWFLKSFEMIGKIVCSDIGEGILVGMQMSFFDYYYMIIDSNYKLRLCSCVGNCYLKQ